MRRSMALQDQHLADLHLRARQLDGLEAYAADLTVQLADAVDGQYSLEAQLIRFAILQVPSQVGQSYGASISVLDGCR